MSKKGSPIAVTMAGTVVTKKERVSQKGSRYAFVKFSDLSGEFEATVFSDLLSNSRDILEDGNPVLIIGKAEVDGEFTKILAQKLSSLEHVMDNKPTNYTITLDNPVKLEYIEFESFSNIVASYSSPSKSVNINSCLFICCSCSTMLFTSIKK